MQCRVCGSETLRVIGNRKKSNNVDVGNIVCAECGAIYSQKIQLTDICINGRYISLSAPDMSRIIRKLQDEYIEQKKRNFGKDEQGDAGRLF